MARAAVVLVEGDKVALIRRLAPGGPHPYYLFPGGGLETGETPEQAARREAWEELGLAVRIERLLAVGVHRGNRQHYYLARASGGAFGSGGGEEMACTLDHPRGTYTPVWLPLAELGRHDARPRSLAALLQRGLPPAGSPPLEVTD